MTMSDPGGGQGPAGSYPPGQQPGYPPPGPGGYGTPVAPGGYPPPPGPPSYAQPAAPPPKKSRRSGLVALGVLLVIIVVIGGGFALFRDRLSGQVTSLAAGDCIDEPSGSTTITDVQHQPCSDPHDGEVFAVLAYPTTTSSDYPGATAFEDFVRQQCLPAVQTYTGRTLDEIDAAGMSYEYFYPLDSSWTDGNHTVTCYLTKTDGTKLTGSVKAAGGAPAQT